MFFTYLLTYLLTYCGAERARKLNERERDVKKYGGAEAGGGMSESGGYRRRCIGAERKFPPLRLRSHMLWSYDMH